MRIFLLFFLTIVCQFGLVPYLSAQVCTGNFTLTSQAAVNSFGACTEITGHLQIGPSSGVSDITDLSLLVGVQRVGSLYIRNNPSLQSLSGLSGLQHAGRIEMQNNDALTNLLGLHNVRTITNNLVIDDHANLQSLEGLNRVKRLNSWCFISHNPALQSVDGLDSLEHIGGHLDLSFCPSLTNVDALSRLGTITGSLLLKNNAALSSLQGLVSVDTVYALSIFNCSSLTNLDGLENLVRTNSTASIENNANLVNLHGLRGLIKVNYGLLIKNNAVLNDIAGLTNLNMAGIAVNITNNPALSNCSILSLCSFLESSTNATISGNASACASISAVQNACGNSCSVPTVLFASHIKGYSARINHNRVPNASTYQVRYKVTGTSTWLSKNGSSASNFISLTDLETGSDYTFQYRMKCATTNTWTDWGTTRTFQTHVCGDVESTTATQASPTRVTVSFVPSEMATRHQLRFRPVGGTSWTSRTRLAHLSPTMILMDLIPGINYEYEMRAECPYGYTPYTFMGNFTLPVTSTNVSGEAAERSETASASPIASIFPNPVQDRLFVVVESKNLTNLEVLGLQGKVIFSQKCAKNDHEGIEISTTNMASGLYYLRLSFENGEKETLRFVKN